MAENLGQPPRTFHLLMSSVSHGFSFLCVEGMVAPGAASRRGCSVKVKVKGSKIALGLELRIGKLSAGPAGAAGT